MTIALWCLLIAGLLPIGFVGYAKLGGKTPAGVAYDNSAPRAFLADVGELLAVVHRRSRQDSFCHQVFP